MLSNEGLKTTVVPVQGTFDIAHGRNTIRNNVTLQHWPFSFNARASTAMTALGELILLGNSPKVIPVQITFINDDSQQGVQLSCRLPVSIKEEVRWRPKIDNLVRIADHVDVKEERDYIDILACIWV